MKGPLSITLPRLILGALFLVSAVDGFYFLATGITGLTMFGIQTFVQNLFYGGGLVLAVALSQLVRNREAQDFS